MAFDITKPVTENTLTPEEKTWLATHEKTVSETAAAKALADAETARKAALPATYEIKLSEGSLLNPAEDTARIAAYAKAHGLTMQQAEALTKEYEGLASTVITRTQAAAKAQAQKWAEEVKADKDLGGANYATTEKNVKQARDWFEARVPGVSKFLEDTGAGSNPLVVKMLNLIGKRMGEDPTILRSLEGGKTEYKPGERMFKKSTQSAQA